MIACITLILCAIGLVPGTAAQTFTSDPANNTRTVGETFRVTCDSNTQGVQPTVVATNGVSVTDVSPQGTDANIRIFETNVLTRENNGAVLTCTAGNNVPIGSGITLTVLFPPLITGVNNITANAGDKISFNVTIDANPPVNVSAGGITVTPILATVMLSLVNATTVSVTIPSVTVNDANQYTITASNSAGSDTVSFVLIVNEMTPTPSPSSTDETQQVTATETTASNTRSTSSVAATMSFSDMPPSPSPTGETTFSGGKSVLASATIVLFLMSVLFFIN